MSDDVWVSRAMNDSRLFKAGSAEIWDTDPDAALDAAKRAKKGELLTDSAFPNVCYNDVEGRHLKNLPPFFELASFWMVTSEMADLLSHFNLGRSAFHTVEIYQYNRKTRVEGDYFIFNIAETKNTLNVEASRDGIRRGFPDNPWDLKSTVENDQVVVAKGALEGPDIWFEEAMWKTIFLNGRVVEAMREAKLTRRFPLRKCRIA